MRTTKQNLLAGETLTVAGGNSFHLILAQNPMQVEYLKADGTNINQTAKDVDSGYFVTFEDEFSLVKITNGAVAQDVKFAVARDGRGGYNTSSTNITSMPDVVVAPPDVIVSNPAIALVANVVTLIAAAGRKEIFINANVDVFIGSNLVTVADGMPIKATDTAIINTSAELYCISPVAAIVRRMFLSHV